MNNKICHILVVDDDDRIRDLVKMYLEENNFMVTTAKNSIDAKENASAGWEINDTVGDGPGALVMAIEIGA